MSLFWTFTSHADNPGNFPLQAEREDDALLNVLDHLGYLHSLATGNQAQLRSLMDVNLNKHLSKLRESRGAIRETAFRNAEIRILNAVALLWEQDPPFQTDTWRPSEHNASWFPRWRETHEKNLELLRWARAECAKRLELKCRTRPSVSLRDSK